MTCTLTSPAGSSTRPAPSVQPIEAGWIDRGLDMCERALDVALATDDAALAKAGASVAKVVAESAILLRILHPHHRSDASVRLAARLAQVAVDPRTLAALALHASASFELAVPYLVLHEQHRSARVDALLRTAFAARAAQGRELHPHRRLERLWLLGMLTGRREITSDDVAGTVLAHEIDLLHGTRDDHYAFTHALMYATDFGRDPGGVPEAWKPRLIAQARSALAGALDEDDYDLAGELLLTWPFLAVPAGPVESAALAVVRDVAKAVGTLPSLTLGLADGAAGLDEGDAVVLSTYHTSFVFTALAALAPLVDWQPLAPGSACTPGASLADRWPAGGRRPGWLTVPAAELPADPLPLEAGLRRAVREHRLAEVAELLSQPGTPATPLTRQALDLVERLSLL
ncbi:MAG: hypothetical protein IPL41_08150 [Micropruina sp.]|nr:hypothetical protein [Micropruina sp.]